MKTGKGKVSTDRRRCVLAHPDAKFSSANR